MHLLEVLISVGIAVDFVTFVTNVWMLKIIMGDQSEMCADCQIAYAAFVLVIIDVITEN